MNAPITDFSKKKIPKEIKVSWLSNDRDIVVVEKGQQRLQLSVALFGSGASVTLDNINERVAEFLARNPKVFESPITHTKGK